MSRAIQESNTPDKWVAILTEFQDMARELPDDVWRSALGSAQNELESGEPANDLQVFFDGRVENGKYRVEVGDTELWLTQNLFNAFLELAVARLNAGSDGMGLTGPQRLGGSRVCAHTTIKRLRDAIDDASGISGVGQRLIRHHAKSEYSLVVELTNILAHPRLLELAPTHISAELASAILDRVASFSG